MKAKLMGFKYFVGSVDGKDINSGRIFIEVPLDATRNEPGRSFARGVCQEELRNVPVNLLRQFEAYPIPCEVEIQTQRVGDGKGASRESVLDMKPVSAGKA